MNRKLNDKRMGNMIRYTWLMLVLIGMMLPLGAAGQDTNEILTMKRQQMEAVEQMAPLEQTLKQLEETYKVNIFYKSREIEDKFVNEITQELPKIQVEIHLNLILEPLGLTYRKLTEDSFVVYQKEQLKKKIIIQETVEGMVFDGESGDPLPGVNILVKGTNLGASTNVSGEFDLVPPSLKDTLVVSFIGYETKEIPINGQTNLEITLLPEAVAGEELVVVGYGEQKKISLTSSISSVPVRELRQSPTANISNALAGRLPGLISVQHSGEPGRNEANIWIRGFGTYNSSGQDPLILVDGIERTYRETFDNIDPNNIESISILKDASATAIYGVRGANGVVLVKTKRGKEGKPQIDVSLQSGIQAPTRLPDYLDSYEALNLYKEGLINDGQSASLYTDEYLNKFKDRSNPTYQYLYPNVNWLDTMLRDYAPMSRGNINVSGGSAFAKYFVSASYFQQSGLYNFADEIDQYNVQAVDNKYNFLANTDLNLTNDLSMIMNLSGIFKKRNYPSQSAGDIFNRLKATPSWWYPFRNPDGSISGIPNKPENPYSLLTQHGFTRRFDTNVRGTAGFTLDMPWIIEGLRSRVKFTFASLSYRNTFRNTSPNVFQYNIDENASDLSNGTYTKLSDGTNVLNYDVGANERRRTVLETYLNYETDIEDHSISGMLYFNRRNYNADVGGGLNNVIPGLPYKSQGIVGRAKYDYKDKYLAEFNFGYNGSENFKEGKRYGFFPSISLGWVASAEPFVKRNLSFFDLLKFRISAGEVGNDEIGGRRFLYQSTWTLDAPGYTFGYNYDGNSYSGAQEDQVGNPNVTWERARKFDIGLDLGLLSNELTFTGDIFYEHRNNILSTPGTIPSVIGVESLPQINIGIVENKGFDLSIEYNKYFKNQSISAKLNYTFARNRVLDADEPSYEDRQWQSFEGRSVGEKYGLVALGLFKDEEDIQTSPRQTFGEVQPGDIKYKDLNSDGIINNQDEGYLGKVTTPETIFGLSLGYSFKGLDASIFFQGGLGGHTWYTGSSIWPFSRYANVLADVKNNYWNEDNPDPGAKYPRMTSNDNPNNYRNSTFWLRSNDYVRLKNAEIGYSFSKSWLSRFSIVSARIFANGQNLFTWSKLKLFDPEAPDGTGSYPQQKVFNIGINFTF